MKRGIDELLAQPLRCVILDRPPADLVIKLGCEGTDNHSMKP